MPKPTAKPDARPSLTGIEVAGFKSIKKKQKLTIRPLTLLAGANSSGKSSMLQPLLLLKQTIDAPFDPGPLRLNGPNLKFTKAAQVLSRAGKGGASTVGTFSIQLDSVQYESLKIVFKRADDRGFEVKHWILGDDAGELLVEPDPPKVRLGEIVDRFLGQTWSSLYHDSTRDWGWGIAKRRFLFDLGLTGNSERPTVPLGTELFRHHLRTLTRAIHVPGLRGTPERAYQVTSATAQFAGRFDDYVASVIHTWEREKDPRLDDLGHDLQELGLTWKVRARSLDDTQVELMIGRLPKAVRGGAQDLVNIADVGFGVSQVLPVLVAILAAEPGQLVIIEQPEIHLHPRAHVALAAILAREAANGKLLVVETHSPQILRGVQTAVAEKGLAPDQVALHWFTRDPRTGQTEINLADLDAAGTFGDWPVDFDDVSLSQDERYVDAAFEAMG